MIIHDVDQRSEAWYSLRAGMPTASEFSKLVTSTGDRSKSLSGYARTLAAETYAGGRVDAWEGNGHTERGRELEPEAIARYVFECDAEVTPVGFVTTDDGVSGCSPDGLVGDHGVVEVKCLKAENHIAAILYHKKHGGCPADYVQQTQGQMWITGRLWCDIVFYHPSLPLLVIRQTPILSVVAGLVSGIREVIAERDAIVAILRGK